MKRSLWRPPWLNEEIDKCVNNDWLEQAHQWIDKSEDEVSPIERKENPTSEGQAERDEITNIIRVGEAFEILSWCFYSACLSVPLVLQS